MKKTVQSLGACVVAVGLLTASGCSTSKPVHASKASEGVSVPDDPTMLAIEKRFGPPDRVSGSGRGFLHYDLSGGRSLVLVVSGGKVVGAYEEQK